jgi:TamB, inner membrane protein subunit of TAM complex
LLIPYIAIHIRPVQNWLIHKVTASLSEKLHTTVSIQHIDLTLFNKMQLNGLLIKDHNNDTLLYAGDADVEITDWFFLKDRATIKYLALNDAVVNMQRTDSVWNYQFLADYFSSPEKDTAQRSGLELDLKTIQFQNITFNKTDGWVGKNMRISIKQMDLDANNIDLGKKQVDINTLDLDEPAYAEFFYPGNRPDQNNLPDTATQKNGADTSAGLVMNIKKLHLNNGSFSSVTKGDVPDKNVFDGDHINFFNITGDIQGLHFEKDSLAATIDLAAKERCGLEVKKIKALMKFTPREMEFNGLDLTLNRSRLKDYYAMHFHHFNNDMANFLHNVTVKADFQHSDVSSDDIAFFAPSLSSWKKTFNIQGEVNGTIDNLVTKRTVISTGSSIVDGDIELTGLPDINNTFIDFKSNNLVTNYKDVTTIVPALKSMQEPDLSKLTNIKFKGNFTGFIKDFVAFGNIQTNLGNLSADINLKFPDKSPPIYLGKISTNNFNLGMLVGSSDIGNISFDGTLKGQGFTANDLNTALDGNVRQIQFDGYNYQNISLKGSFDKKLFNGDLSINDPNIKLDNLRGSIDFNNEQPDFNFDASLAQANLKALNLTNDDFKLSGHFRFNFKGSNIDNFAGTAKIYNASLLHNDMPLPFDSLILSSQQYGDDKKLLTLHSNELNGHINGKFKIMELQDAFKVFLNHYYPTYIQKPGYSISDQDFSFDVETKDVDDYTQLIDPKLSGFSNSTVSGNLDLKNNALSINATVPQFGFDGKVFNNIRLQSNGNLDTLTTKIDADDIQLNDSLHLPSSTLTFSSHNDISDLDIETSASQTLNGASLIAQVQTLKDGVSIDFAHSSFIINDKKWELAKDGQLTITKGQVTASNIKLTQDYQQITLATQPSDSSATNDILVGMTKVSIGDIAPYVVTQPRLEGLLTGNAVVSNIFTKPSFTFNTTTEQFRLDGDSIGVITTKGDFSTATGLAKFHADADNKDFKFAGDGTYNVNDSSNNQMNIAFIAPKFDLGLLNNYLGSVFTDIKGTANTSNLKITGNAKHLFVTGTAAIFNGSFRVNYTQCKYSFNNQTVTFNPDEIDLGSIQLKDTLNNTATVTGKLYHNFFADFGFNNVRFETKKLLVLNTTRKDNNQFYGKVIGSATMVLNGPVTNMLMDIDGEPSRRDSSQIYLLGDNSIENGNIDYIDFKQYGKKMTPSSTDPEASNILVNMRLTANPFCKINVILDETTGDVIQGTGNGQLNIRVGTIEPLSIRGKYDITKGNYTFNFQTFLKKPFTLTSGSIVWTGDPYEANIDITAEYLAVGVDFSSLGNISGSGSSALATSSKSDVRIVAHLTEKLDKPKIGFEFLLPDYSALNSSSAYFVVKRLQEFKNDENEMNKQVTSVLLFNSFIDNNQSFLSAGSGVSVLSSTIGGVVSGIVSDRFNKLLEKYIKNTSFYLNSNLSSSTELEQSVAKLQAAVKSGVVVTFLNGRLIISAGVNLDYNDPYAALYSNNTSLFITPDFTAEWLLTKDGHVRVVGFNKTSFDITGQRNRSGLKLSYGKDFDFFSELFATTDENKKKKKQ